uniref:Uncharacterized protein n=1 Tax=Geospiza parvula TaxID=87175 RepID=A0A8C3MQM2_GEOPR
MEYCSSGSLLNVLEDPANAFGLAESEFLIVLQCVVAGMNHLRENGVVHRDIKPGNIMRLVGEDGQSIYKLTDFGAARELEDDEKFVSVYGTEEYLHPDVYERAVLRKPQQKAFGVTVDLWSIGVTFYHAATGSLPFVPFGGPRRNKEIMYKITTEKPPGAIAGIQRQENGSIEWSYELPITCRLSTGLKDQLIPILANILEVDQEKCWGFDQFFAGTNDILHRMVVDVFSLQQASSHRIYIHSYNTTTKFLDAVFKQTNIVPHHQEYFFEGHLYELDPNLQAHHFCKTTESSPLTLLSTSEQPEDVVGVRYRDPALEFPKFVPRVDVVADCSAAKVGVCARAVCWQCPVPGTGPGSALCLAECRGCCSPDPACGAGAAEGPGAAGQGPALGDWEPEDRVLQDFGAEEGSSLRAHLPAAHLGEDTRAVRGRSCRQQGPSWAGCGEDKAAEGEEHAQPQERPELSEQLVPTSAPPLQVDEELSQCSHSIFDFQGALDGILAELVKDRQQVHEDKSIQQMECCLEKMQMIHKQFKKARTSLRLSYNEEQIHKLDKLNLGNLARRVLSIFQNDCVQQYQEALAQHSSRMRKVCEIKKHLKRLSNRISACSVEMMECQDCLQGALDRLLQVEQWHLSLPVPPPVPLSQACQEMALRMQELLEQMRSVACDLQLNNSIIERLGGAAPAPSV